MGQMLETGENEMKTEALANTVEQIKKAKTLDIKLLVQAIEAMEQAFPKENYASAKQLVDFEPTEAVLHLIEEHLPEWAITLKGRADEVDGNWTCTLRKTDAHDDDAFIGIGSGPTLSLALLMAVLRASIVHLQA